MGIRPVTALWIGAIGFMALAALHWRSPKSIGLFASSSLPGVVPFVGEWVQMQDTTVHDLLTFYGPGHGATCRYEGSLAVDKMAPYKAPFTYTYREKQQAAIAAQKALQVGSYRWVPAQGRLDDWDPVRVIERMIMSRIGLIAVGDSLTNQMIEAFKSLLLAPIPESYNMTVPDETSLFHDTPNPLSEPKHLIAGKEYVVKHSINGQRLDPNHPITHYLKAKHPEIPEERWKRPFMWTLLNDFGITPEVMDRFILDVGLQGEESARLIELAKNANRFDWPRFLQHYEDNHKPWPGVLKDVLILNTGAHWPGNFGYGILGNLDAALAMYPRMVDNVLDTFAKFNRTLTGIIKSGYRAHPDCGVYDEPWTAPADFSDPDLFPNHGWFTSPTFDEEWIQQIGSRPERGRARFMDLRLMEGLRADAHSAPSADCLHWCSPYVPGWWMRLIWQAMEWSPYDT